MNLRIAFALPSLVFAPLALAAAAPFVKPAEPVKGVYSRGVVFACAEIDRGEFAHFLEAWHVPIQGGKVSRTPRLGLNLRADKLLSPVVARKDR